MRRKREKVQPIEGLEPELIAQQMVDGLMPVDLAAKLDEMEVVEIELEQRRYNLARMYLVPDADTWTVMGHGTWKRSFKGATLYYYVFRDKLSIRWPGDKVTRWFPNAFKRLYMMLHTDGFEANMAKPAKPPRSIFPMPDEAMLSPTECSWLKNIPPSAETLRLIFGWDADWQVLFYANTDREVPEIVPYRPFIKIDGVPYAYARVVSMLLYGNPHGVPDADKAAEILASFPRIETAHALSDIMPTEKAKAKRPIRKRRLQPPAPKPFWRLRASEQARILLRDKEPTDE